MDFFERQDQARRRTGLLVACYAGAVLLTILAVYAVLAALLRDDGGSWWQAELFFGVAGVLGVLILGGSWFKITALASGGAKVAAMLGGRELSPDTTDPDERRLLNVVEEMAIASGIAPPPVFILEDEAGINAFAAGLRPADAVIGVTEGCLRQLTRDELQGVVAHEFSHVLNGDMRLNLRLIGVLHGLLMIHLVGMIMLRSMMFSGAGGSRRRSSSGRGGDGRAAIVIFLLGLAMTLIGFIGVVFGRLIKSAVSRQREHLADAAAVQFTRNPTGLAGALKKIAAASRGSRIRDPHAEELSHLFFANGLSSAWLGLMATHPPLKERIRRLDPAYGGSEGSGTRVSPDAGSAAGDDGTSGLASGLAGAVRSAQSGRRSAVPGAPAGVTLQPNELTDRIGSLDARQLDDARALLAELPESVRERLHHSDGAKAVALALLGSSDSEVATVQRKSLADLDAGILSEIGDLRTTVAGLDSSVRLAMLDLAIPALQRMSAEEYRQFIGLCRDLVAADGRLSVFEYSLLGMIDRHVSARFESTRPPAVKYYSLNPLMDEVVTLLGVLARFGNPDDDTAALAVFEVGLQSLPSAPATGLPDAAACSLPAFDRALNRLRQASLPIRKRVLQAGAICVASNGRVNLDEGNLLRTLSDAFDAPMPPLVAS